MVILYYQKNNKSSIFINIIQTAVQNAYLIDISFKIAYNCLKNYVFIRWFMKKSNVTRLKIYDMALIAVFTAIITVCSWLCIPAPVPFTLQTFGIFLTVGVWGGKKGTLAVCVYLLLGIIGLPVFAGFNSGLGYIAGSTGGYILGFLPAALVMWAVQKLLGNKNLSLIISMAAGLLVCYAFGTVWFMSVYTRNTGKIGFGSALLMCVVPYIIPDAVKISLAILIRKRFIKILKIMQ